MFKSMFSFMIALFLGMIINHSQSFSHCDTESGPVIKAAKQAIKTGNVNYILIWVQKDDSEKIIEVFNKTILNIKKDPTNQENYEKELFTTLLKVHREGEGAEFSGIKDDNTVLKPIKMADSAIDDGSIKEVSKMVTNHIERVITEKFTELEHARQFDVNDVEAGREYVRKYVEFMHLIEGLHNLVSDQGHGLNSPKIS